MDTRLVTPGLGHNLPPTLEEELITETQDLATRAHELVINADERAEIYDDESASKAVLLLGMMKEHVEAIEVARMARKEPFLEGGRIVDRHFHGIMLPLAGANPKAKLEGSAGDLLKRIDAWRAHKDAEAAAERQRLEEEARKQRQAAEAAQKAQREAEERAAQEKTEAERRLQEAQRAAATARTREEQANALRRQAEAKAAADLAEAQARQHRIEAQLAERKAEDEAARLDAQAQATVARPIDSGFGPKASGRLEVTVEIVDLGAAIIYCQCNGFEGPLMATVQTIYDRLTRGKNGARDLPGAKITERSSTTIRRR